MTELFGASKYAKKQLPGEPVEPTLEQQAAWAWDDDCGRADCAHWHYWQEIRRQQAGTISYAKAIEFCARRSS